MAAPTAGLHFTPEILQRIRGRGIEIAEITLHVGLGTFQPVRAERVEDHKLHSERYQISSQAAKAINGARAAARRIVAVGTTTVRTLEHASLTAQSRLAAQRQTSSSIPDISSAPLARCLPIFTSRNPSLLMLVSAFAGKEQTLEAYRHAVEERYRFYSYGDCMFMS